MNLNLNNAEDFDELAEQILNKYQLVIAGVPYRIHEIEFYLSSEEYPDPYVHCDVMQKTIGKWYFHRKGGSYKGGTFKGLDITFGENCFGGILIRAISREDKIIDGPCRTVDEILRQNGSATIADFVNDRGGEPLDVFECNDLKLQAANINQLDVYSCRRIGLKF
jgi:3-methyladenine DNA glycosylase Mpg